MTGFSLVFEPLSFGNYKWQGEFGPSVRGPQAYSQSSPLPLPSTLAGAFAAALAEKNGGRLCSDTCKNSDDPYCSVRSILSSGLGCDEPILRGPFYYVEGSRGRVICLHHTGNNLLCIEGSGGAKVVDVALLQSVGIALNSLTRTVLEGYIYTMLSVDLHSLASEVAKAFELGSVERHGVLVELHNCNTPDIRSLDGKATVLGGEQRPHKLHVLNEHPLTSMLREIHGEAGGGCLYWHIASPVLLCKKGKDCKEQAILKTRRTPREALEALVREFLGLKPCPSKPLIPEGGRLVFSAVGLGYSYCMWDDKAGRWVEGKRKYCPAIMPGWGVYAEATNWLNIYTKGANCHRDLAWGTIVPLPDNIPEKLSKT